MSTENLLNLKIHKVSSQQYVNDTESGALDPTALYLTPAEKLEAGDNITIDEDKGAGTVTFSVKDGTTAQTGVVRLSSDVSATEESFAATPKGVSAAFKANYITAGCADGPEPGYCATAEGYGTTASGDYSHAEGLFSNALGNHSHAEGAGTVAENSQSHAEGDSTTASGIASHAEGTFTTAFGADSHAEGCSSKNALKAIVDGIYTKHGVNVDPYSIEKENLASYYTDAGSPLCSIAAGDASHTEGTNCITFGDSAHAEGVGAIASGCGSHAEGSRTTASGGSSHAEGDNTTASGVYSHAEGYRTIATGQAAHAEGKSTSLPTTLYEGSYSDYEAIIKTDKAFGMAIGGASHVEGLDNVAFGWAAHAEGTETRAYGDYSHAEGSGTVVGELVYDTLGTPVVLAGTAAHAEGYSTKALRDYAHAEGCETKAVGASAHAEGTGTIAYEYAHAEGKNTTAGALVYKQMYRSDQNPYAPSLLFGTASHAEGISSNNAPLNSLRYIENGTEADIEYEISTIQELIWGDSSCNHRDTDATQWCDECGIAMSFVDSVGENAWTTQKFSLALGNAAHAEGKDCLALSDTTHAEGTTTIAIGKSAHSEGINTIAHGEGAHAEGYSNKIPGSRIYAADKATTLVLERTTNGAYSLAKGKGAHTEGINCIALGDGSHAEGEETFAKDALAHASGYRTYAAKHQFVIGCVNDSRPARESKANGTDGTAFIIGNGSATSISSETSSNAFRVDYSGTVYSQSSAINTGADYAEYFEWVDSNIANEDRRGYFVTLDGEKIKLAQSGDYLLGIVSGQPAIIGNGDEDWRGRYILDEFGAFITEEFEYEEKVFDEEAKEEKTVIKTGTRYKQNPDYDPTKPYIQRADRPEWAAVGMMGVLSVRDDGTCQVNGYCTVADGGIATASESGYRVIKRVNDHIVKVIFR